MQLKHVELTELYQAWDGLIDPNCIEILANSRFLQRCLDGTITHAELKGFLAQQYFYARHFVKYICSLMANLSAIEDVHELLHNLCEEMGMGGNEIKPHSLIYKEMLVKLNIDINHYQELQATSLLIKTMLSHCTNSDAAIGLAALCLGAEAIVPYLYTHIVNGFLQKNYQVSELEFFVMHIECDDEHAVTMKNIIKKIIQEKPEKRDLIIAIGKEMINLRRQFLDAIADYYSKEQAA